MPSSFLTRFLTVLFLIIVIGINYKKFPNSASGEPQEPSTITAQSKSSFRDITATSPKEEIISQSLTTHNLLVPPHNVELDISRAAQSFEKAVSENSADFSSEELRQIKKLVANLRSHVAEENAQ